MSNVLDSKLVRSGTWGALWMDGEQVAECYGFQLKINKNKGSLTGSVKLYNATSRLLEAEGRAMAAGEDIRHTIISNLDDPDNPRNQRIAVKGVIFDDLTLADWEAAKLGTIEAPFSAESYEILDY